MVGVLGSRSTVTSRIRRATAAALAMRSRTGLLAHSQDARSFTQRPQATVGRRPHVAEGVQNSRLRFSEGRGLFQPWKRLGESRRKCFDKVHGWNVGKPGAEPTPK